MDWVERNEKWEAIKGAKNRSAVPTVVDYATVWTQSIAARSSVRFDCWWVAVRKMEVRYCNATDSKMDNVLHTHQ